MVKIFKNLARCCLVFCGIFLLFPSKGASFAHFEQRTQSEVKATSAHLSEEEEAVEKDLWQEIWELTKERAVDFLHSVDPFSFVKRLLFTLFTVHFLIDQLLRQALQVGARRVRVQGLITTPKTFAVEGLLFYALNIIRNALSFGALTPILARFENYNQLYRLLCIVISTSFIGISISPERIASLLILILATAVLSWAFCPKEHSKKAYMITNVIFVVFSWGLIQSFWHTLVLSNRFDGSLQVCGIDTSSRSSKELQIRLLLMCNGNLGIITIWRRVKQYFYVRLGNGTYIPFHNLLVQSRNSPFVSTVIDFFNKLPSLARHISQYTMQNIAFEFARELFL